MSILLEMLQLPGREEMDRALCGIDGIRVVIDQYYGVCFLWSLLLGGKFRHYENESRVL